MTETAATAHPLELRRIGLIDRFHRSRPKIVAIVAAAGFGKSTIARQLVADDTQALVCDCTGVRDDLDLARRIIATLGLYQQELLLGDGGASVAERLNIALNAWRNTPCSTFVFENAEHIVARTSARDFFGRLLNERPEGRTIVVCSREGLRFHLTRYAAPHEIMMIRGRDLAFDAADLRTIFGPDSGDEFVERVLAISQGWPIAVLLLHRFWTEGRVSALLERLDDIAFEQLHDYLADEVLATVETRIVDGLFTVAAVPNATAVDLRLATGDPRIVEDLMDLARESAFLSRAADGTFHVHPLLGSLLLENAHERRVSLLQEMAGAYEGQHQFVRAAQLYQACGDQRKAAQALARYEPFNDHVMPMPYATILSTLDREVVLRYPRLWGMTAMLRTFYVDYDDLLDEAESVWRTLSPDTSKSQRSYVFLCRMIFMGHVGRYEEALVMLNDFMRSMEIPVRPATPFDSYVYYVRATLLARMGRFTDAERELTMALPLIDSADVAAAASFALLGGDVARPRGERAVERQLVERALERARTTGLPNFVAHALSECAISAWLAGDEESLVQYAAELEETVERFGVKAFSLFAAAARGRIVPREAVDVGRAVAFGRLMAIARATSDAAAAQYAREALEAAEDSHQPYLQTLASVAVALTDDEAFEPMMERAQAAAARCEAEALQTSIAAIAERRLDCGALAHFVRMISRARDVRTAPVAINVVSGTVAVDGKPVSLATRELELLVALAIKRETTSRQRLASMLWPDVEEASARNALSVCLHRLRSHVGRDDVIVRDGDGYRVHPDANVDLWAMERAVASMRMRDTMSETDRAHLHAIWSALRMDRPARMDAWEWFAPVERRLGEFRIEIGHRLAQDALRRNLPLEALAYADDMIAYDSCDEPARDVAIRAHLALDDRAAAMRQFRQYRETLLAEMQCEPSAGLRELVGL